ncbi:MAG: DUF1737 domain-containing protein [Croceibacterium sp.]
MSRRPPDGKPLYRCLTGRDDDQFCKRVSQAVEDGWLLHGSPTLAYDPDRGFMIIAQAVVWPDFAD